MARKNLEVARKSHLFSQKQLADKVGISDRMYRYLEAGTSQGSVAVWSKLSEVLGVPVDTLIKNVKEDKPV